MLSKSRRQLVGRLKNRKQRSREGLVLVEGTRSVREALAAGGDVRFVVRSPRSLAGAAGDALSEAVSAWAGEVVEIDDAALSELSDTAHPQGILCVCAEPSVTLADLAVDPASSHLLLDGLQDPGNSGTLVRAARAFGIDAVIVLEGSVDPWNPKSVRASAGACFHTPIVQAPWSTVEPWLSERGIELLAADPEGTDVRDVRVEGAWALAVGNEGAGLRASLLDACTRRVAVPMKPGTNSLNAGVAGSILIHSLLSRDPRPPSPGDMHVGPIR